jgi:protein SCO1/2
MNTNRLKRPAVAWGAGLSAGLLSLGLALAGASQAQHSAPAGAGVVDEPEATTEAPRRVPRWILQGPGGRAVTALDFAGRYQLVAFGYVSCPDVCPTTMLEMQQVLASLGEVARKVQPLFISVDPQRDSLPVLAEYTRSFDDRIIGLTSRPELVAVAAKAFDVRYEIVREPGAAANAYTVDHTAGLFLVGPEGQLLTRFGYSTPVDQVVARIRRWLEAEPQR